MVSKEVNEELFDRKRDMDGDLSGRESSASTFYPDNLQRMRQEFAADRENVADIGASSAQNASYEGGSPLTADEAHDENFRRMLDKYYSEVDDGNDTQVDAQQTVTDNTHDY